MVRPRNPTGPVLQGAYQVRPLKSGGVFHASDAVDLYNMVTRVEQNPGVTIQIFMEGAVNASVGGRHLIKGADLGEAVRIEKPLALITTRTKAELFERRGLQGNRMRKVSVTLPLQWLDHSGLHDDGESGTLAHLCQSHLAGHCWHPSADLVALAERMIAAGSPTSALGTLYLESEALRFVAECLSAVQGGSAIPTPPRICPRDQVRMARVEDYLNANPNALIPLEDIAQAAAVSISTLQRLFQSVHGMSAFEFLRRRNLDRARAALDDEGLSVKEAAFLAGYSSPANFSTAFRKHYGRTPRQKA